MAILPFPTRPHKSTDSLESAALSNRAPHQNPPGAALPVRTEPSHPKAKSAPRAKTHDRSRRTKRDKRSVATKVCAPPKASKPARPFKGGDTTPLHASNLAKIKNHIRWLARRGRSLPARPARPQRLSATLFAQEADVDKDCLLRLGSKLRQLVDRAAAELGVTVRLRIARSRSPRLKDALVFALAERRRENIREGWSAELGISQLRAVYAEAGKRDRLGLDIEAAAALACLRPRVDAARFTKAFLRDLSFAERCLQAQLNDDGLPSDFGGALAVAIQAAGLNPTLLARRVGATPQTVINWARGRRSPDPRFFPVVRRIEVELRLQPGRLVRCIESTKLTAGRLPIGIFPVDLHPRKFARLRARISRLLPENILSLSVDKQYRLVADARERCAREDDKGGPGNLLRARYALKVWPAKAEHQFASLAAYKHRIICDDKIINRRPWGHYTTRMRRYDLARLAGFLVSPQAGDMRIKEHEFSLALLAIPDRIQRFIDFKSSRVATAYRKGEKKNVVRGDADLMGNFGAHFSEDGWIRHDAGMRRELGYANRKQEAWDIYCGRIAQDYKTRADRLRRNATTTRDPHAAVKPILWLDEPLSAVKLLIDGLCQDYRGLRTDKQTAAELLQDIVYTQMQAQAAFRSGTTVKLEYRTDNTGHLRKDKKGWYLAVPKELFKNGSGAALRYDYYRRLRNQWGFYPLLERFLLVERDRLLNRKRCPFLFLYGNPHLLNIPVAVEARPEFWEDPLKAALAGRVRTFTARHLGWDPNHGRGIEGVICFSPSGFRHIVATSTVKRSRDYQEAADAIADSLRVTILHYAQYEPSDRAKALARTQTNSARAAHAGADKLRKAAHGSRQTETVGSRTRNRRKTVPRLARRHRS